MYLSQLSNIFVPNCQIYLSKFQNAKPDRNPYEIRLQSGRQLKWAFQIRASVQFASYSQQAEQKIGKNKRHKKKGKKDKHQKDNKKGKIRASVPAT